ncbi:hypothetical protein [Paraburkholderia phenazinium]|uniref:hypothetical protein n=1 Tax=Paraburkholderia phenazinium TaxID=60549 RepID=UPI00158A098A|nr:hypothetical protein [Paraburkholderia phenazinium]
MALKHELTRQRAVVEAMEATCAEATLLANTLEVLLCDADFIATLKAQGFNTLPRLLHERLLGGAIMTSPLSDEPLTVSRAERIERDARRDFCHAAASMVVGMDLPVRTINAIRQMTPARQVVAVGLMCAGNNFGGDFARGLLAATPRVKRIATDQGRRSREDGARRLARVERQLLEMLERARNLESVHFDTLVYLAVAGSAVRSWMVNKEVVAWLGARYPRDGATLMRIAGNADYAKEAKRPMKLPYGRERVLASKKKVTEKRG